MRKDWKSHCLINAFWLFYTGLVCNLKQSDCRQLSNEFVKLKQQWLFISEICLVNSNDVNNLMTIISGAYSAPLKVMHKQSGRYESS